VTRAAVRYRFPFAPLEEVALREVSVLNVRNGIEGPILAIATRVGVNRRSVFRWRKAGLDYRAADRAACALGLHPSAVWPEWWEVAGCPI
jgi:hypothetical protein